MARNCEMSYDGTDILAAGVFAGKAVGQQTAKPGFQEGGLVSRVHHTQAVRAADLKTNEVRDRAMGSFRLPGRTANPW